MVSCIESQNDLIIYQKYGTGQLLRLCLDRIYSSPEEERSFQNNLSSISKLAYNKI